MDLETLTDVMLDYMTEFQKVACQGTVDEKRRFIRAFTKGIELDPRNGKGRAQFFILPDFAALSRFELYPPGRATTARSSFNVVAGAGFEPATSRL